MTQQKLDNLIVWHGCGKPKAFVHFAVKWQTCFNKSEEWNLDFETFGVRNVNICSWSYYLNGLGSVHINVLSMGFLHTGLWILLSSLHFHSFLIQYSNPNTAISLTSLLSIYLAQKYKTQHFCFFIRETQRSHVYKRLFSLKYGLQICQNHYSDLQLCE